MLLIVTYDVVKHQVHNINRHIVNYVDLILVEKGAKMKIDVVRQYADDFQKNEIRQLLVKNIFPLRSGCLDC